MRGKSNTERHSRYVVAMPVRARREGYGPAPSGRGGDGRGSPPGRAAILAACGLEARTPQGRVRHIRPQAPHVAALCSFASPCLAHQAWMSTAPTCRETRWGSGRTSEPGDLAAPSPPSRATRRGQNTLPERDRGPQAGGGCSDKPLTSACRSFIFSGETQARLALFPRPTLRCGLLCV